MGLIKSVSIWVANTNWEESTLREVMTPAYSEDGDFLGSEFTNTFSLGFVDDDSIEADKVELTKSLSEAIDGFSYDTDISADFKQKNISSPIHKIDTLVLVYDYKYFGAPLTSSIRREQFFFLGNFEYSE
ncbi:immunity 22 family protein [Pseudomonas fluorescens]|uniref:immunity 22 family protein n=1 Tax=Pseudomonas TaxID=286 RepID=UPI003CFD4A9B